MRFGCLSVAGLERVIPQIRTTMLASLIVCGLCLLLLLVIVYKAWRSSPETRSTSDDFGQNRELVARKQQSAKASAVTNEGPTL